MSRKVVLPCCTHHRRLRISDFPAHQVYEWQFFFVLDEDIFLVRLIMIISYDVVIWQSFCTNRDIRMWPLVQFTSAFILPLNIWNDVKKWRLSTKSSDLSSINSGLPSIVSHISWLDYPICRFHHFQPFPQECLEFRARSAQTIIVCIVLRIFYLSHFLHNNTIQNFHLYHLKSNSQPLLLRTVLIPSGSFSSNKKCLHIKFSSSYLLNMSVWSGFGE